MNESRRHTADVVVIHPGYRETIALTARLGENRFNVMSVISQDVPKASLELARTAPDAMIVGLRGSESVVELREVLQASVGTRFVILVPDMPPSAALARLAAAHGAAILWEEEQPVVVVSTLISLLAQGIGAT